MRKKLYAACIIHVFKKNIGSKQLATTKFNFPQEFHKPVVFLSPTCEYFCVSKLPHSAAVVDVAECQMLKMASRYHPDLFYFSLY